VEDSQAQNLDDDDRKQFKYSNMQVVLLTVSCMYFLIGSTLEYTKHSGFIAFLITIGLGGLKLGLGAYTLIVQINVNEEQ
jgi:hypothetical protein